MFTIISRSVCQTANFCRHVQISQLNLIPKLKDIFKTVKKNTTSQSSTDSKDVTDGFDQEQLV